MKFRTEIEIAPFTRGRIGYENRTLALGSCFAGHVAERLARAKFRVTVNPTGILFNPLSIAAAIRDFGRPVLGEELIRDGGDDGQWFHFGFHGDFSAPNIEAAFDGMNAARRTAAAALASADRMILTFGTAWVYERNGEAVANCHRQPPASFVRRRLTVDEIVRTYSDLIEGALAGREIILTVSPVRHLGDGLAGNAASKAVLRLAAEELTERFACVHYFPAYECLVDDLRDYRFYADDLTHPSPQAVAYVWERFAQTLLTPAAQELLPVVEAIASAAAHRPRNPQSEAHKTFCRRCLERIAALPEIDFSVEAAYFRRCIEIIA